uniref:Rubber elongation factor protein n=1 Tax=Eucommia ulmoides TaxID=4392 RepID=A0A023SH84_EUCUL|nr:rubber elongation factor protein [Eucommia ulmoides]
MASDQMVIDNNDRELKHLDFVRIITLNALLCLSNMYNFVKQMAGPLKFPFDIGENAVGFVAGPAYEKFKGVSENLLAVVDDKVDVVVNTVYIPPFLKSIFSRSKSMAIKASEITETTFRVARVGGIIPAVRYLTTLVREVALTQLVAVCYAANQSESFRSVAWKTAPTAAHWSENYNNLIEEMVAKGYTIFSHLPLVPIDELGKAYKRLEAAAYFAKQGIDVDVN